MTHGPHPRAAWPVLLKLGSARGSALKCLRTVCAPISATSFSCAELHAELFNKYMVHCLYIILRQQFQDILYKIVLADLFQQIYYLVQEFLAYKRVIAGDILGVEKVLITFSHWRINRNLKIALRILGDRVDGLVLE